MMKNKTNFEDDGRTIADMSSFKQPGLFDKKTQNLPQDPDAEPLKGMNKFYFILGTLKATLLIGTVYVVVFGLVILALTLLIKYKLS